MGACSGIGRVILIILNLVFLLIALAMMAVGGILRFAPGKLMMFLAAGADTAIPTLSSFPGVTVTLPKIVSFVPMFGEIGIALLISGAILFVLSFLACCGACCKWRPFLIVFIIIMIVIIVILAAMGGLFLVEGSILHENIKKPLVDKIAKGFGTMATVMNLVQVKLECCGVSGKGDYVTVPMTCCKDLDSTSSCNTPKGVGFWEEGCYDKMFDFVKDNKTWSIVALVVLLVLLLLEVIFAVVIVKDVGDSNKVGPI